MVTMAWHSADHVPLPLKPRRNRFLASLFSQIRPDPASRDSRSRQVAHLRPVLGVASSPATSSEARTHQDPGLFCVICVRPRSRWLIARAVSCASAASSSCDRSADMRSCRRDTTGPGPPKLPVPRYVEHPQAQSFWLPACISRSKSVADQPSGARIRHLQSGVKISRDYSWPACRHATYAARAS